MSRRVVFDLRSTWRAAWVVVSVGLLVWLGTFFLSHAASTVVMLCLSFFMALAMEPIVGRLAAHMPRLAAVALTLGATTIFLVAFFWTFGSMLAEQLAQLITALPGACEAILSWINTTFGTNYAMNTILSDLGISSHDVTTYATSVAGSLLQILGGAASGFFQIFTFAFFLVYLSIDLPRLRSWIAGLLPPRNQVVFLTIWQTMLVKVGGYVGARVILALINSSAMGVFMFAIDLPYWLPLAIWTGLVAQFVPTIGTYISIALPVVVGLGSGEPADGAWVLLFAIVYQQIENVFIEPRISSRAVDVHPAVSFGSAIIGAQLFGLVGATLGVPVAATAMALFDLYKRRWAVSADTEAEVAALAGTRRVSPTPAPEGTPATQAPTQSPEGRDANQA